MKALLASCAVLALFLSPLNAQDTDVGQSMAPTANTVLAVVNGTEITLGELIVLRSQLPERYNTLAPEVLYEGLLDQLIQQQLLSDTLADTPARLEYALTNEERRLKAGEVIATLNATAVNEQALEDAYDARFDGEDPATEYNASHILVDTQEEAAAVRQLIEDGADFALMAREHSTGPSGPNGGSLGWFPKGVMVPEFEETVVSLEIGQLSEPVQTQFGWHLVFLEGTRDEERPSLNDLRSELIAELQRIAFETRLEELTEVSEIDRIEDGIIDPAVLTDLDLLEP